MVGAVRHHHRYRVAGGMAETAAHRKTVTVAARIFEEPDFRTAGGKARYAVGGGIAAAIVDDEDFAGNPVGLHDAQQPRESLDHAVLLVPGGDDNGKLHGFKSLR